MTSHLSGSLHNSTKAAIRRAGCSLLAGPMLGSVMRRWAFRKDPIVVLVYHTLGSDHEHMDAWTVVKAGEFERQIAFMREHYDIISLDAALSGQPNPSHRPRIVITFDDGDVGLYTHLLPIVERLSVPVTAYIATRQIEESRPYWFDRVMNAVQTSTPITLDLSGEGLGKWTLADGYGSGNWQTTSALLEALKRVDPARRERVADAITAHTYGMTRRTVTPLSPLSLGQLQGLAASRWIAIGSHTHCHSLLDQIPLRDAMDSIETSRQQLKDWTGRTTEHFAYPNGNHNLALRNGIEALGFRSATIVGNRLWDRSAHLFSLPRVPIGRYDDLNRFKVRLLGL